MTFHLSQNERITMTMDDLKEPNQYTAQIIVFNTFNDSISY